MFFFWLAKLILRREYKEYSNPHAGATTKGKICNKFKTEIDRTFIISKG